MDFLLEIERARSVVMRSQMLSTEKDRKPAQYYLQVRKIWHTETKSENSISTWNHFSGVTAMWIVDERSGANALINESLANEWTRSNLSCRLRHVKKQTNRHSGYQSAHLILDNRLISCGYSLLTSIFHGIRVAFQEGEQDVWHGILIRHFYNPFPRESFQPGGQASF